MRLHRDHRVAGRQTLVVQVVDQLVERLEARAARRAVFEQEQRPMARFGQQHVELVEVLKMCQFWMHSAIRGSGSRCHLAGFELRTDAEIIRYPHRYTTPRGAVMWDRVMQLIHKEAADAGS